MHSVQNSLTQSFLKVALVLLNHERVNPVNVNVQKIQRSDKNPIVIAEELTFLLLEY